MTNPKSNMSNIKSMMKEGLWNNNPVFVQLLGLCPLLAVSSSVTNALGLSLATLVVLIGSNVIVSLIRNILPKEIRLPVFVMVIAALVTCVQLLLNAYAYTLYLSLGIFIPLIVTNCIIIGRAESFAAKNTVLLSAFDGLWMGLGMSLSLITLGAFREILGSGTLFNDIHLLFGDWATGFRIEVFQLEHDFLLALLPPGAFFCVGFLIAAKNVIDQRLKNKNAKITIERARVTAK